MVTLRDADDGKTMTVRLGELISIVLPENPTTGYRWQADISGEAVAGASGAYVPGSGGVGGGGERVLTFTARQQGTSTVHARLQRPWEATPVREYAVTITVEA